MPVERGKDSQVSDVETGHTPAPRKSGCGTYFLIGCAVLLILGIVGGILVARNFERWAVAFLCYVAEEGVKAQNLPEDQKQRIIDQVRRLEDEHAKGNISREDLRELMTRIVESPLVAVGLVIVVEQGYLNKSGLPDEEKATAAISLRRFVQGVVDGDIDRDVVREVAAPMMREGQPGQIKQTVTDEELRQFIAAAQREADQANVPAEPRVVDIASEVEKVIDGVLGQGERRPVESEVSPEPAGAAPK